MARINPALREPTFEAVRVGEPIGPVTVVADAHYRRNASFAVDDFAPPYASDDAATGQLVPATAVARDLVALFCTVYDPSRVVGLHQKEEVWFHRPIRLGTTMHYTGRYTDKYERRGKGYVVFESEARDARDGALLVRQISTEIMRVPEQVTLGEGSAPPDGERVRGKWPANAVPALRATADLAAGTPIPPLVKTAHQDQMSVFSGAGKQWFNIHTDVGIAQAAGFRDTLAQGMMETCWIAEMLAGFFGAGWMTGGWIKTAFLKPVFRNDTLTCRGVVTGVEHAADGTRLRLEVWAENQDGVMTAAGWASGRAG
jgi:acyl dehydratase